MKITVIYGTHATASRSRFQHILDGLHKRGWEIVHITSGKMSVTEILSGVSLFDSQKAYVCEDLKILDAKVLKWIEDHEKKLEINLLLYHDGDLPVKLSGFFSKRAKLEKFELPKTIFIFLDSIYPGNSKQSLKLLHEVTKSEPIEFVFALMGTLFRDLYWVKNDSQTMSIAPWRQSKLKSQASKFSDTILIYIIRVLAELDIKVKTSQTNLSRSLDLFILKELK